MRILVEAKTLGEKPSGIGIYLYCFIQSLYKQGEEIILVTDISLSKEMKNLSKIGIKIIEYKKRCKKNFSLWGYFRFIQNQIYRIKPDIFWEGNNVIPYPLKNPYGQIYVTIHDIFPITQKVFYPIIYQLYFRISMNNTMKIVDGILYNSIETKKSVESYYPRSKKHKNFISYIIVEHINKHEVKDENYFLYIGNCEVRKGTDILLEAYKKYIKDGGKKSLYIAGKVRERKIEEILKSMKGIHTFKYLGYISEDEKEKYLAECSCFVFPSMAEGFGIPILEAINYEKKVIASNLKIFKEIIGDSIEYFDIKGSKEEQIKRLSEKLFLYENSKFDKDYIQIQNKYKEDNLGRALYLHWNSEKKNEY